MNDHPLRCQCGTVKGFVTRPGAATRAICYCKDCQAFARFLGRTDAVLDVNGGTPIVATLPGGVHFTQGIESLRCMSLSPRGLLRWYAGCCNTPIGNTPRNYRMPYIGLVETCLHSDSPTLQQSFGPVRMVVNTGSSRGPVPTMPLGTLLSLVRVMGAVIGARLSGAYRRTPLYDPATGVPRVAPRELTLTERRDLY